MKIGVFGHYGNRNLGDEAIITATIQNIRKRFPEAEIFGLSIRPEDTAVRHRIPAYPIRNHGRPVPAPAGPFQAPLPETESRIVEEGYVKDADAVPGLLGGLRRIPYAPGFLKTLLRPIRLAKDILAEIRYFAATYRYIREWNLIIVAGSNQFLDNFGGPWGFPFTLLKWTLLAKSRGVRIAFASVGAGPLTSPLSKLIIRMALSMADYVSYRDRNSKLLVESPYFAFRGQVFPDLASSLELPPAPAPRARAGKPVVGINPMPVYDSRYWHASDETRYRDYIGKLSAFTGYLLREGYPCFFFPTQSKDDLAIRDVIAGIEPGLLTAAQAGALIRPTAQVGELVDVIRSADIVVPTRFHGAVLALHACKPTLAICYYRKTGDLLRDKGQGEYAVDLDGLDVEDMIGRFRSLVANLETETAVLAIKFAEYWDALETQYREIFSLVG